MSAESPISRRRLSVLWVAVAGLLVAGTTSAYIKQGPTEVSVDSALAEFRRTTTTSATPLDQQAPDGAAPASGSTNGPVAPGSGPSLAGPSDTPAGAGPTGGVAAPPGSLTPPAEGVYPQATEGYEYTDALGGSRHDYPRETSITLRRGGCGIVERWQPLQERYDESEMCSQGETVSIFVYKKYNEFFQRSQLLVYNCPGGAKVFHRGQPVGATWTWTCNSNDSQIDALVTVVGFETVNVGGRPIEAVRMRYDSKITGSSRGTQVQERLLERSTGYVVSVKVDVKVRTNSPFGEVGYEEHYVLQAKSMQPRT